MHDSNGHVNTVLAALLGVIFGARDWMNQLSDQLAQIAVKAPAKELNYWKALGSAALFAAVGVVTKILVEALIKYGKKQAIILYIKIKNRKK